MSTPTNVFKGDIDFIGVYAFFEKLRFIHMALTNMRYNAGDGVPRFDEVELNASADYIEN